MAVETIIEGTPDGTLVGARPGAEPGREAEPRHTHDALRARQRRLRSATWVAAIAAATAGTVGARSVVLGEDSLAVSCLAPAGALVLFGLILVVEDFFVRLRIREADATRLGEVQVRELEKAGGPELGPFMAFSHRQMNRIESVAVRQATVSHLASVLAATAGFVVLAVGASITLTSGSTTSTAAGAVMTAVGTALAGFLSRTFIHTYETTVKQMSHYSVQPVVNCYLLHAELLAQRAATSPPFAQDETKYILKTLLWIAGQAQNHQIGEPPSPPPPRPANKG